MPTVVLALCYLDIRRDLMFLDVFFVGTYILRYLPRISVFTNSQLKTQNGKSVEKNLTDRQTPLI